MITNSAYGPPQLVMHGEHEGDFRIHVEADVYLEPDETADYSARDGVIEVAVAYPGDDERRTRVWVPVISTDNADAVVPGAYGSLAEAKRGVEDARTADGEPILGYGTVPVWSDLAEGQLASVCALDDVAVRIFVTELR